MGKTTEESAWMSRTEKEEQKDVDSGKWKGTAKWGYVIWGVSNYTGLKEQCWTLPYLISPPYTCTPPHHSPDCFFSNNLMFSTFSSSNSFMCAPSYVKFSTPVSKHQSKSFTSCKSRLSAFTWQTWTIKENVNICFLVTGQVYVVHLYWWMLVPSF